MLLTNNFSLNELIKSATAERLGIPNIPNEDIVNNLQALCENILQPLREAYGHPIVVDSGYRCSKLNKAVGGSSTSQHMYGEAADIHTLSDLPSENKKLFDLIVSLKLPFDQLINEYDYNWIHVSFSPKNRRKKLKAVKIKGKTQYIGL